MDQELEKTLWATADKLRNNMDAAEYKHRQAGGIPYEEKVATISENLKGYFKKSIELQQRIKTNLVKVGIEI